MKGLILIGIFICFCFASGGDTIKYTADVKNLKDGDNFYSDIHYHSMKDSIAKIVNGKLGNINIASDAEIDLNKLDTAGNMKMNTLTSDKVTSDTVIVDTAKILSENVTRETVDSSYNRVLKAVTAILDSLNVGSNGITLNGGDPLKVFDTGSFPCTLSTSYVTTQKIGIIKYVNIGNKVTLSITGVLYGTSNSTGYAINIGAMPESIMPDSATSGSTGPVHDNSVHMAAFYYIVPADKKIYINRYDGASFSTSGNKGINLQSHRTELEYVKH